MAYLTKEKASEIRKGIRKHFPGWKFSIVNRHLSVCDISILQAPVKLIEGDHQQLNHYNLKGPHSDLLKKIVEIAMDGNHDRSDSQSDYFDVGWYLHLSVGAWDKPFIYTGA